MIGRVEVELIGGQAIVHVDSELVDARVRVTFKRDGSLSTLRIGQVTPVDEYTYSEATVTPEEIDALNSLMSLPAGEDGIRLDLEEA